MNKIKFMGKLYSMEYLNNYKNIVFSIIIFTNSFLIPKIVNGQQPFTYTQYMINPLPFNSAFSLVDYDTRSDFMLRKQWLGIHGSPETQFIDGYTPVVKTNGETGAIFENDKIGIESLTQINGFYAQTVKIGKQQFLGLSLNLGFRNYSTNYSSLLVTDPIINQDIKQLRPNLGFGLLYFSENFYAGISAPQLSFNSASNTNISQNNNFRNDFFFTTGISDNLLNDLKIKFATLITYSPGIGLTTDVSSMFSYREVFEVGLNYRTNNEAALIIETRFHSFKFGYSYQFGINPETNVGGSMNATQELNLSFNLGHKRFYVKKSNRVF